MYLRETKRKNKDGSVVRYLSLAHNYRDPDTGVSKPEIIYNFGRAENVDKDGLRRLIGSIARELDPVDETVALASGQGEVRVVEARDLGGVWVLDALWQRLGIDDAIRTVAEADGRRIDADKVERVLFALVASRALAPSSKLEACRWIAEEVHIDGLAETDPDSCYRAMDFLLDALDELQETVFFTVADLLQLEVDLIFLDTTSTYFEIELPDDHATVDPDGDGEAFRTHGHSKDRRPDLPQVVIGMAVTRGGMPVRLWVWPGDTSDQTVVEQVKTDLAGWQLNRTVWICDSGFNSADNRKILQRGGSGFIVAEKLRSSEHDVADARSRQGRYRTVDDQLQLKEIWVGQGPTAQRFIMCRNLAVAERDAAIRDRLVGLLEQRIDGSDDLDATDRAELRGRIRAKPGLHRYLRTTKTGLLRVDRTKIADETKLDGKFLLRTSDPTIDAEEVARGYKALADVERAFRDLKQLDLRPVFHRLRHRIVAHIQLCWLSLLLIRVAELAVGDTWRNIAAQLDRLQLVTLATDDGTVAQRSIIRRRQREILDALDLPEPPRYFDFDPTGA